MVNRVKVFSSDFVRSLYSKMYKIGIRFLEFAKASPVFDKYVKLGVVFALTGAMGLTVVANAPSLLDEGVMQSLDVPSFVGVVNALGLESDDVELLDYKLDPYYEAVLKFRVKTKESTYSLQDRPDKGVESEIGAKFPITNLGLDNSWMLSGCPFDELANTASNLDKLQGLTTRGFGEQTRTVVSGGIGSSEDPDNIFRTLSEKKTQVVFKAASKESKLGIDEGTELQGEMFKVINQAVNAQKYLLSEWLKRSTEGYTDEQLDQFIEAEPSESDLQWIANKLMLQLQKTEVGEKEVSVQIGYVNKFLKDWFKCVRTTDSVIEGDKLISHEKYSIVYNGEEVLKDNFIDVDLTVADSEVLQAIARFDKQSQIAYQAVYQDYQVSAPGKFEDIKLGLPLKSDNISSLVSSEFGSRDALSFGNGLKKHTGTDFATKKGTKIYAAQSGKVVKLVRSGYGYGNYLIIDHNGYQTLYAHCNTLLVNLGDDIALGQEIAEVGCTGWSTGNHLHFEVIYDSTQLDPMQFLKNPVTAATVLATTKLSSGPDSAVSDAGVLGAKTGSTSVVTSTVSDTVDTGIASGAAQGVQSSVVDTKDAAKVSDIESQVLTTGETLKTVSQDLVLTAEPMVPVDFEGNSSVDDMINSETVNVVSSDINSEVFDVSTPATSIPGANVVK